MMRRRWGRASLPRDHYLVLYGQEVRAPPVESLDWEPDWSWDSNVAVEMVLGHCLVLVPKVPAVVLMLKLAIQKRSHD